MRFADYLRRCRERLGMTQEGLAEALYFFDETFAGTGPSTLSRWERGTTTPPPRRMARLIAYFQEATRRPFPCLPEAGEKAVEPLLCSRNLARLFRPRTMVGSLPLAPAGPDPFRLRMLRHHPRAEELLELNAMLHRGVNTPFTRIDLARFRDWADHPGNDFYTVTHGHAFLGLLFTLRLRPESFDAVVTLRRRKSELGEADFAAPAEAGSIYLLSFYTMTLRIATLLFRRLLAHLVAYQHNTAEIGFVTSFDEAKGLAHRLGLNEGARRKEAGVTIEAYRASLAELMRSPMAMRALFPKEPCRP